MKSIWAFAKGISTLFLFVMWLLLACAPERPIPEVDSYYWDMSQLEGERSATEIVAALGEPPFKYGDRWVYPIRNSSWNDGVAIPAPVLRVSFDLIGRVVDWGFYHPVTDESLPIRESVEDAHIWLDACRIEERIELASILQKGVSRRQEVYSLLNAQDPFFIDRGSLSRFERELEYFVDRPSPLYIESSYYIRWFYDDDNDISEHGGVASDCNEAVFEIMP